MGIFSDIQGQLTPQSVVRAGRNSNSFELSCMSLFPARCVLSRLTIYSSNYTPVSIDMMKQLRTHRKNRTETTYLPRSLQPKIGQNESQRNNPNKTTRVETTPIPSVGSGFYYTVKIMAFIL